MKVCFITVNYNNSSLTIQLMNNIYQNIKSISYDFVIVDNNSKESEKIILKNVTNISKVIFLKKNIGYFPAVNRAMMEVNRKIYDYIIVSNNDIIIDKSLENALLNIKYTDNVFVICPDIIEDNTIHRNPMASESISKIRIYLYDIYFSNYIISIVMIRLWKIFKKYVIKKNINGKMIEKEKIVLGYGAFYIFRKMFYNKIELLDHPKFLMGEEVYLANQVKKYNGILLYEPQIKIIHNRNSSTKKISSKRKYLIEKESYSKYRRILKKL